MNLRPYQIEKANECNRILYTLKLVYLSAMVRTGKSLISLKTAELYGAKNVLFLTKKKAIESVQSDYNNFGFSFDLTVINNESAHKVEGSFDFVILDESHRFGSFPKPSKGAKDFKQRFGHLPMVLMSGTPTPESYSQWFHQFWVSNNSPFKGPNFYKWAKKYVNVKQKHLGYGLINDYSDANLSLIQPVIKPYLVTLTQAEAGFVNVINEHFVKVKMKGVTYQICDRLMKDNVFEGKTTTIIADTAAKLQSKLHQLYSGTIKFEEGNSCIVDNSKAIAIKQMFEGKKIAIFYKFIAEKELLIDTFGELVTDNLEEFNTTNKSIIGQIQSIREGVKLDKAEAIVYYNIDFSALSYLQGIDRMTTIDRLNSDVYWFFSEGGIEQKIYKSVKSKKNYSLSTFKKDYGQPTPKQS